MKSLKALFFTAFFILILIRSNAQNCTLKCPSNIVVKADSAQEGAIVNLPQATIAGECGKVSYSRASGSFFRLGSHSVIATTSNGQKCSFTITVTDNESPVLSAITLSPQKLWPASNDMKDVNVNYTISDNAVDVNTVLSVSSNDKKSGIRDWEIVNNRLVRLKASRLHDGSPRIYTITVTSTDSAGNRASRKTSIAVSKTMTPIAKQIKK